jgi:hypothetical protein
MNKDDVVRFTSDITFNIPETSLQVIIRNIKTDDIHKILQLQEASFADMALMVWYGRPLF